MSDKITLDRETFKVLAADTRVDILKSISAHKKTLTDLSEELNMSPSTVKEHLDKLVLVGLIYAEDKGMKWKYYKLTEKGRNIVAPVEMKVWILLGTMFLMLLGSGLSLVGRISQLASFKVPESAAPVALQAAAPEGMVATVLEETSTSLTGAMMEKAVGYADAAANAVNESVMMLAAVPQPEGLSSTSAITSSTISSRAHEILTSTTLAVHKTADYALQAAAQTQIPYLELGVFVLSAVIFGVCVGYILKKRTVIQ